MGVENFVPTRIESLGHPAHAELLRLLCSATWCSLNDKGKQFELSAFSINGKNVNCVCVCVCVCV